MRGLLAAAFVLAPLSASAVELTAGGVVNPIGHLLGLGVEVGASDAVGIELQGTHLGYEFDQTDYHEEGSGPILGLRARWYPQDTGNATHLWLAGGLMAGSVNVYWRETDAGTFVEDEDKTTNVGIVQLGAGYKILFGDDRFVFDPQILLAYLVNAETDTNVVAGLGLSAGVRF